ncbi:aldo/keto reductase [Gorgonomyces haynaldii]|nr:aldo/keto reductase [Gorgonomyces haynaldii]
MSKVQLGKNGPLVSRLGFGAMGMSAFYGGKDDHKNDEQHLAVLNRAIDLGCTFWDTADMYGPFTNEELLAKVLKTRRSEVFLATKFAIKFGPNGMEIHGEPEYVKQACEDSLKRLGVSQIDLYYQHRPDPKTPIEETVKAMAELVKEGKVKYLGLSECSADEIRRAYKIHPIHAYQVEYSPWFTNIETDGRLQACRELGIAIIAYSPLGRGMLTGAIKSLDDLPADDWRRVHPRFTEEHFKKNLEIVQAIEKIAKQKGVTPSQLSLAWVMAQGPDFIPIPGTKKIKYLEENWKSVNVKLTEEDVKLVRDLVSEAHGAQY